MISFFVVIESNRTIFLQKKKITSICIEHRDYFFFFLITTDKENACTLDTLFYKMYSNITGSSVL